MFSTLRNIPRLTTNTFPKRFTRAMTNNGNGSVKTKTTVAVCQIRSTDDPVRNLKRSEAVVRKAALAGATACFLPEAADFIASSIEQSHSLTFPLSKHTYTLGLQSLAKELGVYISVGIHELPEDPENDEDWQGEEEGSLRVWNTHVVIGSDGSILGRYRKIHMYDVELTQEAKDGEKGDGKPQRTGESQKVRPGSYVHPPIDMDGLGKVGLEICYDMRFPELHLVLTRLGAEVLTFPSAFMVKTGRAHWATLLRAMAIQNQTYVLASAQFGAHDSTRTSWGEALAFDPWGRQIGRLRSVDDITDSEKESMDKLYDESGEFFVCEVSTDSIKETRSQIPLSIQKRTDVYGVVGKEIKALPK